jgi:nucleotide-binding universal stress UspA family protein
MSFKDILVHVDDGKGAIGRIELAIGLAQAHEAHLTGLCIIVEQRLSASILGMVPPDILADQRRILVRRAEDSKEQYKELCRRAGSTADCRVADVLDLEVSDELVRQARHADVVLLGQPDPSTVAMIDRAMPSDVIMGCGRPVIVVPYVHAGQPIGTRVLVAWDGGREAARAVNDALPILERAKAVKALLINPSDAGKGHRREPGADIALHLARHRVKVTAARTVARDIGVGDAILAEISDDGIDLLVMGAYGHSRAREFMLGGVTRQMLTTMPVPVLMSH